MIQEEIYTEADKRYPRRWSGDEENANNSDKFIEGAEWMQSKADDLVKETIEMVKPKWISVKDRMPTEEGRYLCMVDDYDAHEVVDFINGYFNIDAPVEYWMPLPEPPK